MKTTQEKVLALAAICLALVPALAFAYAVVQLVTGNVTSCGSFEF